MPHDGSHKDFHWAAALILHGPLGAVNHEDLYGALLRFQFQAKLFPKRREDRWTLRGRRGSFLGPENRAGRRFGSPLQIKIIESGEAGFIEHRTIQLLQIGRAHV